ncbi:MAG: Murein DD-endopeptidase MepM [candidate division WS2 bacterium ADurb.Bin280]|uniref:Murein DD-endopeptidase MepM n=1 Tax=candidate division WS2 bacterium ADurb.Bin280 TaxID=1852829 RepID=A0A1V5SFG3_9BACT|nr:MAG: Murein DD-endopeptidase MepM [candidate division WS2 bacterium ADurb.Bin280]
MSTNNLDGPSKHSDHSSVINKLKKGAVASFKKQASFVSICSNFLKSFASREKKLLFNLTILLVLVLTPWISEVSANKQLYLDIQRYSSPLDPIKAGELSEKINQYTPGIEEKKDEVALSIMTENDSYTMSQQLAINTGRNVEEPQRQAATYQVEQGETIIQIANKFNLHVATILDANSIKPEESKKIKPGTILSIPSSDTSTSNDWLVAINKAEDLKRKLALSSKALAASSKQTSSGYDGVDRSGLITPVSGGGKGISQYFTGRHTGVDYMGNMGTPILAALSGRVILVATGWNGGYGNQVIIDHGGGRTTRYAHLSSFNVSAGQTVSQGQQVGGMGNTGRVYGRTGIHLHFELIINGRPVNPLK